MRFPFRPPGPFWREWLLVSLRVFARTAVALFVVMSLAWPLLRLLMQQAASTADGDDAWPCESPARSRRREE
ncbi:hypothetical protein [Roseateles sp. BYS96W]|uniref:Uncharacterized protein n=1 Tax=Pelomonas nitida TaxID=3299027 RepID=A0ABW7G6S6_9BURK